MPSARIICIVSAASGLLSLRHSRARLNASDGVFIGALIEPSALSSPAGDTYMLPDVADSAAAEMKIDSNECCNGRISDMSL